MPAMTMPSPYLVNLDIPVDLDMMMAEFEDEATQDLEYANSMIRMQFMLHNGAFTMPAPYNKPSFFV